MMKIRWQGTRKTVIGQEGKMTHHDRKIFGFRFLLKIFGFRFCWKYFGFRFCWNAESFSVTEKFSVFLGWDRTNDAELTPKPVSALHFRFYRIGAEPNLYPWSLPGIKLAEKNYSLYSGFLNFDFWCNASLRAFGQGYRFGSAPIR